MSRIQFERKIDLPRAMGSAWKVPIGRCAYFLRLAKNGVSYRSPTPDGLERRPPVRRVADLDRRRHGARLLDDAVLVDRRRAGGLEADHAWQLLHAARAVVLAVAAPVRGD